MITVTKKQASIALLVAVFATAMIAGTIASSADNSAFATHGKKAKVKQSISEACDQKQNSPVLTAGAVSPSVLSGINVGLCVNANLAGNAAAVDQSSG